MDELIEYLRARWLEEIDNALKAARYFESAHRERWEKGRGHYGAGDVLRRGSRNIRIAETHDENIARHVAANDPAFVIADRRAKLAILDWHENWPVLVERTGPPRLVEVDTSDPSSIAMSVSRQMEWMTTAAYIARFGTAPPTSPIILHLAQPYAHRPDFRDEWRQA